MILPMPSVLSSNIFLRDGSLTHTSFLPRGMSMEEAERIVGERTGRSVAAYNKENMVRPRLIVR
jgi:hypothetical protein